MPEIFFGGNIPLCFSFKGGYLVLELNTSYPFSLTQWAVILLPTSFLTIWLLINFMWPTNISTHWCIMLCIYKLIMQITPENNNFTSWINALRGFYTERQTPNLSFNSVCRIAFSLVSLLVILKCWMIYLNIYQILFVLCKPYQVLCPVQR